MLHTILGASGVIGHELTKVLLENGKEVRLVSRKPKPVAGVTDTVAANLMDAAQTRAAVKGAAVAYLCAGLAYDHRIWAASWPTIMRNCIDACAKAGARFIFFDNVYMYGLVKGPMTETTPYRPVSKKGEIRARIATELMEAAGSGRIRASIARAADFYGPGADTTSIMNVLVLSKMAKGKSAMWLGSDDVPHSYTYTPDAGKGLYLLGQDPATDNQVWHMPTFNPAPTGKEFINLAAGLFNVKPRYSKLNGFMVKMAGIFDRTIGEIHEMLYQNKYPYIFDSSKFDRYFNYQPTTYEKGLAETVAAYR